MVIFAFLMYLLAALCFAAAALGVERPQFQMLRVVAAGLLFAVLPLLVHATMRL